MLRIKPTLLVMTTLISGASFSCYGASYSKSNSKSLGDSMLGAKASYAVDVKTGGSKTSPTFDANSNGSVKASFLKDTKTVAAYDADLDVSLTGAYLDAALKLGSNTVWSHRGSLPLNKVKPLGTHVKSFNFGGDQKWVYGALKADLTVKGSVEYKGQYSASNKSKRLSAKFEPTVGAAGKLNAKVGTKWTTTAILGVLNPTSAIIKSLTVIDDGVRVAGETVDSASFELGSEAYIDQGSKKIGIDVSGDYVRPAANASVEGFIKYRKLIFNPWPKIVTRTKTFGKKTILNASKSTGSVPVISKSFSY